MLQKIGPCTSAEEKAKCCLDLSLFLSICMDSVTQVNATFPTIFFFFYLKPAFLEQWAFSLENNCLCSTHVFAQPPLLHWTR